MPKGFQRKGWRVSRKCNFFLRNLANFYQKMFSWNFESFSHFFGFIHYDEKIQNFAKIWTKIFGFLSKSYRSLETLCRALFGISIILFLILVLCLVRCSGPIHGFKLSFPVICCDPTLFFRNVFCDNFIRHRKRSNIHLGNMCGFELSSLQLESKRKC